MSTELALRLVAGIPLTAAQHDDNMRRLYGFSDLAELRADTKRGYAFYAPGATVWTRAEGFRYQVAPAAANDEHIRTAAGLKLYVLPDLDGTYHVDAFGAAGDGRTNDLPIVLRAIYVARGRILKFAAKTYFFAETLQFSYRVVCHGEMGTRWLFPAGTHGVIIHHLWSTGHTAILPRNLTRQQILDYQVGLRTYGGKVYGPRPGTSTANLAAAQPGTGTQWILLRNVSARDASIPAWVAGQPSSSFNVVGSNPMDGSNHYFQAETYVHGTGDGSWFRTAASDAQDHDETTMYGIKLYNVPTAEQPIYNAPSAAAGVGIIRVTIDGTAPVGGFVTGLWMRVLATLRDVTVQNFSGDGICVQGQVPGEAPGAPYVWGNSNLFALERVVSRYNGGSGLKVRGSDSNGGQVQSSRFLENGIWGIEDNSFLGNTYTACQADRNGLGNSAGSSTAVVSHGGKRYGAVFLDAGNGTMAPAQVTALAQVAPGTNPAVWRELGEGGPSDEYPAWRSGRPDGTYNEGGGLRMTNNNARTILLGCDSGEDEAGNYYSGTCVAVFGGYQPRIQRGGQISASDGNRLVCNGMLASTSGLTVRMLSEGTSSDLLTFMKDGEGGAPWRLKWVGGDLRFDFANSRVAFMVTGEKTGLNFGTSVAQPYLLNIPTLAMGSGNNARRQTTLQSAPTSGAWARGDIVWNRDPSAGGVAGWICVAAGTPGTWKTFGGVAT